MEVVQTGRGRPSRGEVQIGKWSRQGKAGVIEYTFFRFLLLEISVFSLIFRFLRRRIFVFSLFFPLGFQFLLEK